ncbi:hypothetical protein [Janthinobacterium sp. GMG1]|uniref:hypothetical protein n=1 Tax=Janthinobacterium sp. GMG1 TaxID=3096007 RepID=UPI002ACA1070|nr:hypothetical protein [Janthinobacterium sp. GMG1]MDZ5633933.1 hypothetical protein [Janthinobacterium sp. GMG1]
MKLSHRIQEWAADRVSWVQYPNIRPADAFTRDASRSSPVAKRHLTMGQRFDLLVLSGALLVLGLVGLAFAAAIFYFAFTLIWPM